VERKAKKVQLFETLKAKLLGKYKEQVFFHRLG
jgi:hypothetical protein